MADDKKHGQYIPNLLVDEVRRKWMEDADKRMEQETGVYARSSMPQRIRHSICAQFAAEKALQERDSKAQGGRGA